MNCRPKTCLTDSRHVWLRQQTSLTCGSGDVSTMTTCPRWDANVCHWALRCQACQGRASSRFVRQTRPLWTETTRHMHTQQNNMATDSLVQWYVHVHWTRLLPSYSCLLNQNICILGRKHYCENTSAEWRFSSCLLIQFYYCTTYLKFKKAGHVLALDGVYLPKKRRSV